MDGKNRGQVAAVADGRKREGTREHRVRPDCPEMVEMDPAFAHVPGFSYSVSGEGKAWMNYTEQKQSKRGRCCSASKVGGGSSKGKSPARAPDGGWGWVIVAASLGISLVADGISFSFGIIYIEFLHHFGESKSKTSVIGSLFMAVPLMAGPLASALVDRFGCRSMTILGGVISAAGFVASSRVDSIEVMCFTFGIVSGLGLALCYVTAVVCVAFWFDQKRSLANGLGVCGTGVGTFVFAPLTQALIEAYGWRGTTLVLAGAFLQMCVCGAVMREPGAREESAEDTDAVLREIEEGGGTTPAKQRPLPGIVETTTLVLNKGPPAGDAPRTRPRAPATRSLGDLVEDGQNDDRPNPDVSSTLDGALGPPTDESIPFASSSFRTLDFPSGSDSRPPIEDWAPPDSPDATLSADANQMSSEAPRDANVQSSTAMACPNSTPQQGPHQASAITQLQGLRFRRNSISFRGTLPLNIRYDPRISSCPDIYRMASPHSTKQKKEKWCDNIFHLLKDVVDFSMFLEWHFMLLSFSTFLLFTFFIVPYFYLAEHVISLGYSESEASMLISIIGILNTVGMIALGWAGDQAWMNVTKTYALCLCLCGIFTGIMPLLTHNYPFLAISCALFGLFFASNFSFTPVIIVELISLDRFTMAYGLILLTQGLGNLVGPPLAGWLYDITNTWNLSFYLAGFFIFISGLAIALITCSNNFIVGQRKAGKSGACNQNNEEGLSCKRSLLEAG